MEKEKGRSEKGKRGLPSLFTDRNGQRRCEVVAALVVGPEGGGGDFRRKGFPQKDEGVRSERET